MSHGEENSAELWAVSADMESAELIRTMGGKTEVLATVVRLGKKGSYEFHGRVFTSSGERKIDTIAESRGEAMGLCERALGINTFIRIRQK